MYKFLVLLFVLVSTSIYGQATLYGTVSGKTSKEFIFQAKVMLLKSIDSTLVSGTFTNEKGEFVFDNLSVNSYILKVSSFGIEDFFENIHLKDGDNVYHVQVKSLSKVLDDVQVDANKIRVEQKGDTTQYNADAYKTNPDASIEDLIKKMPGITVENGVVKAQGEELKKIRINGEEFFGDDVATALKNLPADMVAKIQVYDEGSEQAKFSGVSDGNESKALNIITKPDKDQGKFGKIYAGYGLLNNRYLAGFNLNYFKNKRKIVLLGLSNNINQQNFSSEDLFNTSGGASKMSSRGGEVDNFLVGQQSGISETHAFGINYMDAWEKTKFTGSYFFNYGKNNNDQLIERNYFESDTSNQFYNEEFIANKSNYNHRLSSKFDIKLDSLNSIQISTKASLQYTSQYKQTLSNTTNSLLTLINDLSNSISSYNDGFNLSNSLVWKHKFLKPKRTFSMNLNGSYNSKNANQEQSALTRNYTSQDEDSLVNLHQLMNNLGDGYNLGLRISYTEPINQNWMSEVFVNPSFLKSNAEQNYFNISDSLVFAYDSTLSNVFENMNFDNEIGTNFKFNKKIFSMQIGASYLNSFLVNDQSFPIMNSRDIMYHNFLPNARLKWQFSKSKSLMLSYRTNTRNPSIEQLQNVINNSNPLSISSGNTDLKQQYNHRLFGRFFLTNTEKSSSFFVHFSGEMASRFITNSSFIASNDTVLSNGIELISGAQFRQPVNLKGYWKTSSYVSYGIAIPKLKINVNTNLGAAYSSTPGLVNGLVNKSNTFNTNAGLTVSSNISENIDFTVSYAFNFNNAVNSAQNKANNQYYIQNLSAVVNWTIKNRLVLNSNYTFSSYNGLSSAFNQSIQLWNAGIGYKFLKSRALVARISVFDILNNNNSISRNLTETYIEDVKSNVLNRYFMATLTYQIKNFGSKQKASEKEESN